MRANKSRKIFTPLTLSHFYMPLKKQRSCTDLYTGGVAEDNCLNGIFYYKIKINSKMMMIMAPTDR